MDLLRVGWYSTCAKQNFGQCCSLRPYVCLLRCHSSYANFNFAHTFSLIQHEFYLACNLLHAEIIFNDTCSVKLDVILLPCLFTCIKPDFVKFCCLQLNMSHLLCGSRCFKLNFKLKFTVELFCFGCHLPFNCACLRKNFAHKSSFIIDAFPLPWVSRCVNIYFWPLCNLTVYPITLKPMSYVCILPVLN